MTARKLLSHIILHVKRDTFNSIHFLERVAKIEAAIPLAAMTAYRLTLAFPAIKKEDVVFIAGVSGGVGSFVLQMVQSIGIKMNLTPLSCQQYL